ncbi:MAG: CPBP family intramembrane metalloprotease [Clostridia bacterium]|nr:CPBP family intramembrane metalloprotease [Clostridia bacterium]
MMFGVGFLEEIIFRGFLFRGMAKDGLKSAVIVSAVTFGIGHIVNLLNGYDITKNIIQIVFAVAVGFLLVMIFVRTGSLIACIVFHALNNSCTGFASCDLLKNAVGENNAEWVLLGVCLVITALYFLYIWKFIPNKNALK